MAVAKSIPVTFLECLVVFHRRRKIFAQDPFIKWTVTGTQAKLVPFLVPSIPD